MSGADDVRSALASSPAQPVRDLVLGAVGHVRGALRPLKLLAAPLTGEPCAYWAVHVLDKRALRGWQPQEHVEAAHDFEVVDESGSVVVLVERAKVVASHLSISRIGPRLHVPGWLDDFTSAHEIETRDIERRGGRIHMRNKELELRETTLRVGSIVGVLGTVVAGPADPKAPSGYRGVARRLALGSTAGRQLLVAALADR